MNKIKSTSRKKKTTLLDDINEDGFHFYSRNNSTVPNYYPPELPIYPGASLKSLNIDDIITVRIFFGIGKGKNMRIDGGIIDLQIERISIESVMAIILTVLPKTFPVSTGGLIEIFEDEILYKAETRYH